MFFVDDVQSEYDRLKGLGVKFTMPPTKVTGSTIAVLDDTCGNLIQITALDRRQSGSDERESNSSCSVARVRIVDSSDDLLSAGDGWSVE